MDLLTTCRKKILHFRVKELKDVLGQLGLAKQGKKQELVERVLSLLSEEQASKSHSLASSIGKDGLAKLIDDAYRKMQHQGATDLASKDQSSSDTNYVRPKDVLVDTYQLSMKVRCPCGSSLLTESMIQCEDSRCQVWQHIDCVIVPEKPMEGAKLEVPPCFYCELCRLSRADPFMLTVSNPLPPVKMVSCSVAPDGSSLAHRLEKTYPLSRIDKDMLQRNEFDLQAWCILLNDKVPFRMQWPLHTDLQVNGIPLRTTNRPGQQQLGINGRDDSALITTCSREGTNKIALSRRDTRIFSFGIRIVKQRTVQQVLNMVPGESDGERFEDALSRVCRCVGGGNATDNADSDSDLEVVADCITVSLRCPMSGSRMKIAGRFKPCIHMACFDLETFVQLNQRSRKWQCPTCIKNYSLENVIIDPYFNRILSLMRNCEEDITEIEVKPDGSWRVKGEGECKDIGKWHLPDGSLCTVVVKEVKYDVGISQQIKEEETSEGPRDFRSDIKRNVDLELNKSEDLKRPMHTLEHFRNRFPNIAMSNSAAGSYGDEPSTNQNGGAHYDFSLNNVHEQESISPNFGLTYNILNENPTTASKDADVILLSDSDEDNIAMVSAKDMYSMPTGIPYPTNQPGYGGIYSEYVTLTADFNNNNNIDDIAIPPWPRHTNALIDVQHNSLSPFSGYDVGGTSQVRDFSTFSSDAEALNLVDNPLGDDSEDHRMHIFLPSQPVHVPPPTNVPDQTEMANDVDLDNWISLSLGTAGKKHSNPASTNGVDSTQRFTNQENDTGSLLLSMNGTKSNKTAANVQRSEDPFSLPPESRSVRPRLHLSLHTDSE